MNHHSRDRISSVLKYSMASSSCSVLTTSIVVLATCSRFAWAQDDSCRYHSDGECDEPRYCAVGSDCSDCGSCSAGCGEACPRGCFWHNQCRQQATASQAGCEQAGGTWCGNLHPASSGAHGGGGDGNPACWSGEYTAARCCDTARGPSGDAGCWSGSFDFAFCCSASGSPTAGAGGKMSFPRHSVPPALHLLAARSPPMP